MNIADRVPNPRQVSPVYLLSVACELGSAVAIKLVRLRVHLTKTCSEAPREAIVLYRENPNSDRNLPNGSSRSSGGEARNTEVPSGPSGGFHKYYFRIYRYPLVSNYTQVCQCRDLLTNSNQGSSSKNRHPRENLLCSYSKTGIGRRRN